jgi:predicted phage tail protein
MTKVHLLGKAGTKFGKEFNLDIKHAKQLVRAIAVQREGFLNFFFDEQEKGIEYVFKKGEDFLREGEEGLSFGSEEIFIMPVPQGSEIFSDGFKRDLGAVLTIIGSVLVFIPGFQGLGAVLIAVGGYLMFDGIMGLIADDTPPEDVEAAIFGGPVNVAKQGIPIPLCYGKMEVSGAPVNFGFTTKRIKQNTGWVNINDPDQEGSGDYGSSVGGGKRGAGGIAQKIK